MSVEVGCDRLGAPGGWLGGVGLSRLEAPRNFHPNKYCPVECSARLQSGTFDRGGRN